MKKSWHPALMKNQEQVWLKEKEAVSRSWFTIYEYLINRLTVGGEEEAGPTSQGEGRGAPNAGVAGAADAEIPYGCTFEAIRSSSIHTVNRTGLENHRRVRY